MMAVKEWFTHRWDANRTGDLPAGLAAKRRRVAPLRNRILAELPFEHLSHCGLAPEPTPRAGFTIVAMKDRYGIPVRLVLCHQTGLFYLIDRLTQDGYDAFYRDGLYRQLIAAFHGNSDDGRTLVEQQHAQAVANAGVVFKALAGHVVLPPEATLLDVGGSTGALSTLFRDAYGIHATVVDPAADELEVAQKAGLAIKCGTIEQVTFEPSERFDVVFINQTIEHLIDLKGTFTRLLSLLKPTGVIIFDILDFLALVDTLGSVESASRLDHCQFLYDEMIDVFAAQVGMKVESRLFHQPGCILYVCTRSQPDDTVTMPPDQVQALRRRLLTQEVAWKLSPRFARPSLEERIGRAVAGSARRVKRLFRP